MLRFYILWIKKAFTKSFGIADLLSGFAAAGVAAWVHYYPETSKLMDTFSWQIPLWACAAVVAIRLLLAPYWIWCEERSKCEEEKKRNEKLSQQLDEKEKKKSIVSALQQFHEQILILINKPLNKDASEEEIKGYVQQAESLVTTQAVWIEKAIGRPTKNKFIDTSGGLSLSYSRAINKIHNNVIGNLNRIKENLEQIIESDNWIT